MKCSKTTLIAQPLYQVGLRKLQITWQSVKEFDSNSDTYRQTQTDEMPNAELNERPKKLIIWKNFNHGTFPISSQEFKIRF